MNIQVGQTVTLRNGITAQIIHDFGHTSLRPIVLALPSGEIHRLRPSLRTFTDEDCPYDIVPPVVLPPHFWDVIDPRWNYLAFDAEDDAGYLYEEEPIKTTSGFILGPKRGRCISLGEEIAIHCNHWKNSLTKRPQS